jgi:hypothetical protein
LSGGIIATNHHPISDRTRSGTAVLLIVEIRNEGADSLVDSFEVTAESDGVRTLGELHHVPKSLSLSGPKYKGPLVYYGKDEIFTKTALDPIRRGSKAVGLIWAWFPKIAPQTFDVKSLRVSCADIRRKRYTIGLEKDFMPSQPMYVPGLSTGP